MIVGGANENGFFPGGFPLGIAIPRPLGDRRGEILADPDRPARTAVFHRHIVVVVVDIESERGSHAFHVVDAGNVPGAATGFVQRGQQHPGKDRDDRNHHEEFYQRKATFPLE